MKKLKLSIFIFAFLTIQFKLNSFALDFATYKNPENNFSIKIPKVWQKKDNVPQTVVMFLSPRENENDLFPENVSVGREPAPGYDLNKYSNVSIKALAKQYKNIKFLSQETKVINSNKANIIVYSFTQNN